MTAFHFGPASETELVGVDPRLVSVSRRALALSPVDFSVHDGLRTVAEQRQYVRQGVSKTMQSKHMLGHAVDLVPVINGKLRWEWPPIYRIAAAMFIASTEAHLPLRWGGVWDKDLTDLAPGANDPDGIATLLEQQVRAYCFRHPGPDFIDGPHFEIIS